MERSHSLHITVSVGQKNSWGDFLEKVKLIFMTLFLLVPDAALWLGCFRACQVAKIIGNKRTNR